MLKDRAGWAGGGVAVLCDNTYNPDKIKTQQFNSFKHICVQMTSSPYVLRMIAVYRPPSNLYTCFSQLLEELALAGSPIIIAGDFNIHWEITKSADTRKLNDVLFAIDLTQHIDRSTHVKGHIIDYLITRNKDATFASNVIVGDFYLITI